MDDSLRGVFKVIFWCDASGCFQHVLYIYISNYYA